MDYDFWIIEGADGITLFDTGYDVVARDWLGEIPGTSTPECLRLLGIDPSQVVRVVCSHFHYDHIGHLGLFPRATVVAARAEVEHWDAVRAGAGLDGEFAAAGDLEALDRARDEGRLTLVDEPTRIAEHLTAVPVGGHSPGEMLLIVGAAPRPVLLAADAAHFELQLAHSWPFFAFTDLARMQAALERIHSTADILDAIVVPGHDARTRERFPAAPGTGGEVAVVLA